MSFDVQSCPDADDGLVRIFDCLFDRIPVPAKLKVVDAAIAAIQSVFQDHLIVAP